MNQSRLFPTIPHQPHSDTSREAAREIAPHLNRLQVKVIDWIASRGDTGATDEEIQRALGMNPSTQRPRRIELLNRGLVVDSGSKRRTSSGRSATVWVLVVDVSSVPLAVHGLTGNSGPRCALCPARLTGMQKYFCSDKCRMTWHSNRRKAG